MGIGKWDESRCRIKWREDSDIPVWYCKQTGEELERDTDGKLRPVKECEEEKK